MKKHILSLFIAVFVFCGLTQANVVTGQAAIPDGYYSGVDGKSSAESILDALFAKIKGHTVISYSALEGYYEQTDFYSDTVWDMYSTCRFTIDDANGGQKRVCDAWNKEHSIPQSWFNEGSPMKSDLFHVYPTDARVNNFRSNLPYGEVAGSNGAGFPDNYQNHGLGKKGSNTFSGYTGTVFEPADDYKGDFARTYFYMVARYRDKALNGSGGSVVFTSNKTNLTAFAKNLFLKWHRQDPVSQKEIDRNQAVYGIQHNRNPFIDYPELAEYIWGNRVGQTVVLASMTPTCEGGGGGVEPVPTVKHGVTWSINGEEMQTDSVVENQKPASLPDEPVSCSEESPVFIGWTTAPIAGTQDDAPAVIYKAIADFPAVTADVTYYAVFAQAVMSEVSLPTTYFYDKDNTEGWTNNNAPWKNSYWLLETGTSIVSPQIDLAQLDSIVVKMRTYGGTQYDQLDIYEEDGQLASMTATKGSTMTEYIWVNNLYIAGISTLTFSSNYGSGKGIGIQSIKIKAGSASEIYVRYITSCGGATEAIQTSVTMPRATKIFRNGQLYIEIGNELYNITGQRLAK